ncbi:MAG: hypothetical protein HY259_15600 [Chloroflexi bacterium]|nr:hypothetical protein [Chloroflexota bacterium]MBI3734863.1 hypothetical protein [Chloroflexota bacterium]
MTRYTSIFVALLVSACAPAAGAPPTAAPAVSLSNAPAAASPYSLLPTSYSLVSVIAHRGGAGLAPENTLASFKNGIALGADFIEMDTHLSQDGIVMVIHDPTLERTTDGAGPVAAKTQAELQKLNAAAKFQNGKVEPQPVPTFAQVLDLVKASAGVRVEVEIKLPLQGRYAGIEEKLLKEVSDRGLESRVQVSSFDFDTLKEVKRLNPRIKTVALMSVEFFRAAPPDQPAKVVGAAQAAGADLIAVNKDLLTAGMVAEAHQRGLKVEVWTVDSEVEMQKFIRMGVDGIISNQPDVLKKVVAPSAP